MSERVAIGVIQLAAKSSGLGQRRDSQLLADFLSRRDPAAFESLVRRHGPLVLAACRQVLRDESAAEDAFQATFLALYQNAAGIRRRRSLGGWLFQVARRTALRARRTADRRARHEAQPRAAREPGPDVSWRDAVDVLHEELARLPATYRDALVLCYLEGLPRDEAARRLGWTVGELRGRLERARTRLRRSLERRGITLSAGLLAAVGVTAVPPSLVAAAVRGSAQPSARVVQLAAASRWGKLKVLSALAMAAGLMLGLEVGSDHPRAGAQSEANEPPARHDDRPPAAAKGLTGRVVDPDGHPVAGAKVWLVVPWVEAKEVARTAADGSFRLPANEKHLPTPTDSEWVIRVVATHERFGLALPVNRPGEEIVLRLVKDDVPIRGRILDLQGKPVAGVTVTPRQVQAAGAEELDSWLDRLKAGEDQVNLVTDGQLRRRIGPTPFLLPVTTDAQGRFALAGVGRERLVELRAEGPTVATSDIQVMTRTTSAIRVEYDPGNPKLGYKVFHGAAFDYAAEPTQTFQGVVTDRETGQPVPKAVVRSEYPVRIKAVADADGRYTLRGLGPGEHRLVAAPPAGVPNLPSHATGGRANNHLPVTLDFALSRGVWLEGTVTDQRTRKPVGGASIYYCPLGDGVVARLAGDAEAFGEPAGRTDAAGKFRIVAAPGAGALAVNVPGGPYIDAARRPLQGDSLFWTHEGVRVRWTLLYFSSFEALAVIEADPKKPRQYSLTVDPGESVKGRVLDPDGKPLAGARASRLTEYSGWTPTPLGAEFEAGQIQSGKPRFVLLWHEGRKLGAIWRPRLGDVDTYDVRLKPNGSASGQLAGKDGRPLPGHPVEVFFRTPGDFGWSPWFPMKQLRTDAKGKFELANLPEGVEFSLRYTLKKDPPPGRYTFEFRVESGEAKDLGVVKPK